MTLSAFAWNIVRTYTLTPGRRYSFGRRYRLGTASNLVMYVSAADNDYVGVTGTFLGTPSQGVWSTARLDFSVPGGIAKLHFGAFGGSIPGLVWTCTACRSGPQPLRESRSCDGPAGRLAGPHGSRGRLGRSLLRSAHSHWHRRRSHAVVHRGRVRQLAEHHGGGQRGPAELRHRNHGAHLRIVNPHTWPHGWSNERNVPKIWQSNTRKKKAKRAKQGRATNYPLTDIERSCYGQASVTGVTGLAIKHCTQDKG